MYKTRCPDEETNNNIEEHILDLKNKGDSVGGKVSCIIRNCPRGLGEPVFNKLEAELARAMLSIPATKGFEIGSGFKCVEMNGSNHNDLWLHDTDFFTETNNNGGVIGGISNGEDIYFSVAFKPPATILMDQKTSNLNGEETILKAKGRHDPCVVPRAIPIVESMTALVLLDLLYSQIVKTNYHKQI
jgi:chorismate synthase